VSGGGGYVGQGNEHYHVRTPVCCKRIDESSSRQTQRRDQGKRQVQYSIQYKNPLCKSPWPLPRKRGKHLMCMAEIWDTERVVSHRCCGKGEGHDSLKFTRSSTRASAGVLSRPCKYNLEYLSHTATSVESINYRYHHNFQDLLLASPSAISWLRMTSRLRLCPWKIIYTYWHNVY